MALNNFICTFDGTFDGFLSVIYYVVKNRVRPVSVCEKNGAQLDLSCDMIDIPTDSYNADKVRAAICDIMGFDGFKRSYYAFLNSDPFSPTIVYKYLMYGFKYGKKTSSCLSAPDIFAAYSLARAVTREVDKVEGFIRFSVMDGGVEYAPFEPVHDILALITPHFADRLKRVPFVIHDLKREKAAVYTTKEWFITEAKDVVLPPLSGDEKQFRALWHDFYSSITIKERKNERLQTQMLPKMYRKHMTEFMP